MRCYSGARSAVDRGRLRLALDDGARVRDALEALAAEHPAFDPDPEPPAALVVMLDGVHVAGPDGRATPLSDGDVLVVSSPMPE